MGIESSRPELDLPVDVGRTVARLGRHVEVALGKIDLTIAQYRVLAQLGEGAEASSSLATKLAVSRPSITAVVEGLVQHGLVSREQSTQDRRSVSVRLTDSGRSALADADAIVTARLVNLLGELSAAEVGKAVGGVEHWQHALARHGARTDAEHRALLQSDAGTAPGQHAVRA